MTPNLMESHSAALQISNCVGWLDNLTYLDLANSRITSLPFSIWRLKNLKELLLGSSNITPLPSSIGRLENLKNIHIYNTQYLTNLQEEIVNLVSLNKLILHSSATESLPPSIRRLKNLEEPEIGDLASLNKLNHQSGSNITSLEKSRRTLSIWNIEFVEFERIESRKHTDHVATSFYRALEESRRPWSRRHR